LEGWVEEEAEAEGEVGGGNETSWDSVVNGNPFLSRSVENENELESIELGTKTSAWVAFRCQMSPPRLYDKKK
jgi:hypothetical protein